MSTAAYLSIRNVAAMIIDCFAVRYYAMHDDR
jgi:hypothetical protein